MCAEQAKVATAQQEAQEETWIPAIGGCEKNGQNGVRQVSAVRQYICHWYLVFSCTLYCTTLKLCEQVGAASPVRCALCASERQECGRVAAEHPLFR